MDIARHASDSFDVEYASMGRVSCKPGPDDNQVEKMRNVINRMMKTNTNTCVRKALWDRCGSKARPPRAGTALAEAARAASKTCLF